MRLRIAKWGNSLAVRLPKECVHAANLKEGASVEANITADGSIILTHEKIFDKKAFLERLKRLHADLPMTEPVVETMRHEMERY